MNPNARFYITREDGRLLATTNTKLQTVRALANNTPRAYQITDNERMQILRRDGLAWVRVPFDCGCMTYGDCSVCLGVDHIQRPDAEI